MKLFATISIEIEAADYKDAAHHQQLIERLAARVSEAYPQSKLDFKARRVRPRPEYLVPATHGIIRTSETVYADDD